MAGRLPSPFPSRQQQTNKETTMQHIQTIPLSRLAPCPANVRRRKPQESSLRRNDAKVAQPGNAASTRTPADI
jgi:hypothetical protein